MLQVKSFNIYDKLIILFIVLLSLGGIGGALQPVRILVVCCMPFMYAYSIKHKGVLRRYCFEKFFFVFWWLWAVVSLLWARMPAESIKHVVYMAINFHAFFVLVWLANRANCPQKAVLNGWLLLFVLTIPVALYELWFDVHLPISVQESDLMMNFGYEVLERRFASVTYGNLNGYNTILCFLLPFVILNVLQPQTSKVNTFVAWILLLCLCYLVVSNSSRGAMFCLVIGLCLFGLYYLKQGKGVLVLLLVAVVVAMYVDQHFDDLFGVILNRFEVQGLDDDGRAENIVYGWDAFLNSGMLGIGAGNYMPAMELDYGLEISAPHNLFLEIGVQYGLFIMVAFLGMLWRIWSKARVNQSKINRQFIVVALCVYPFSHIINSGYLLNVSMWLLLASMYVLADECYNTVK